MWTYDPLSRRGSRVNSGLRVSDAERSEVADRLSKHYGDGRLDQEEFNQRLDLAMKAKTHADLAALFTDLPDTGLPGAVVPRRPRPAYPRVLFLVLVIVVAAAVGQALAQAAFPWLLIAVVVFLLLRYCPWPRGRA